MAPWSSHVSPVPSFPDYTGPHHVGTVDVEIASSEILASLNTSVSHEIPSTVAFRIFYPSDANAKHSRPVYWVPEPQKQTLQAFYAKFLKTSPSLSTVFRWLSHVLYYTTIPAIRNAPLLPPPSSTHRYPVLVFSHGLAGTRNSYSHICGSLASHGIVVVAPDHRDGSSPVQYIRATPTTPAQTVDYIPISHSASAEVYRARDEQLRTRLAELTLIHATLLSIDQGDKLSNLDTEDSKTTKKSHAGTTDSTLSMFRDRLDVHSPGAMTFAGHSFGGATTIQFLKSIFYAPTTSPLLLIPPPPSLRAQITPTTPAILFDPWALPLESPSTAKTLARHPLPCFTNSPTTPNPRGGSNVLTILSEAFFNWRGNLLPIKRALADPNPASNRPPTHIFYPLRSAHLSQSDYGILFPSLTKYLAKADEPHRTLRLNVRATLEVLRRAGLPVAPTSTADMELSEPAAGTPPDTAHNNTTDWRILSATDGAVRGWIAVGADEDEAAVRRRASSFGGGSGSGSGTDVSGSKSNFQPGMETETGTDGLNIPGTELDAAPAAEVAGQVVGRGREEGVKA